MDNANAAHLPNVPAADDSWVFYTILRGCTQDFGRTEACRQSYRLARRQLLRQLDLMKNTVCSACGGKAHRARDCPTNMRLGMLASSSVEYAKLVAWTRTRVNAQAQEENANLLDLPVHHQVPKMIGKKRVYSSAFL